MLEDTNLFDGAHMIIKSCIRAPVLLNLLNSLGKTDEMLGKSSRLIFSPNLFNKFNNTWALM